MDLFSLLKSNLSLSQKVSNAITTKDVALLEEVLQSGFKVNSKVLTQGGYTALHLAVNSDNYERSVVEKLLEYNANPSLTNDFGITPIHTAAGGNNAEVVKILMENDSSCTSVDNFWNSVIQIQHNTPVLPQVLSVFLIATPNFTKYPENIREKMFRNISTLPDRFYTCEKIMVILDQRLRRLQINQNTENDEEKDFNNWLEVYKCRVPTLQEFCRLNIRRGFDRKHNVIYGVNKLYLPNSLKQFIKFSDITSLGM